MTTQTRSNLMARIRGVDTSPEKRVRSVLHAAGYRYRLQRRVEGVRVDVALVGPRVALFVDGCFWHGCPEHYVRPRSRHDFWDGKLRQNVERDRRQTMDLEEAGWRVIRVWEHEAFESPGAVVGRLEKAVEGGSDRDPQWRVLEVESLTEDGNLERRRLVELRGGTTGRWVRRARTTRKWRRVDAPGTKSSGGR